MSPGPFKGLARFEDTDTDAALFFGRERDREIIAANLMASRLTVLYGESGVGKSSLLRAGVAHRLRRLPEPLIVVVFDAWQSDPIEGLGRALGDAAGIEPASTLADTLEACGAVVDGDVYVLLDQVDEYFLYHGDETGVDSFVEQFPTAVGRPGLRATFLLALREETLAKLDTFKGRIPNLFGNYLRLDHLDRAAGRRAILGPLEEVNRHASLDEQVEIEPVLVDAVLDEVAAGKLDLGQTGRGVVDGGPTSDRIETPYLQLVMQRLWVAERESGSRVLRLATLRDLGGAEQIVRDQLRGALDALAPEQQHLAASVFNHLVTPSGTKIAHGVRDLAEYAHVDEDELAPVLSRLSAARILRPVADPSGGERYEIYHDVLAEAALAWKRGHDVDRELDAQREAAARRHRRLVAGLIAACLLVAVMAAVTVFALTQRSDARSQARLAHAREDIAISVSQLSSDPIRALRSALEAARLEEIGSAESALRRALLAVRERSVFRVGGRVETASYSPDGDRILAASDNGRVRIFDARTHRSLVSFTAGVPVHDALFAPDGRVVFTAGDDGAVKMWSSNDGRLVRTLRHGSPVLDLALSRDGRLAVGVGGRAATLWRVADGVVLSRFRSPRPLTHAVFDPRGRLVALGGLDRRALVFSTSTGRLLHRLDQGASVTALAFAPGGRLLVTGGKNGNAVLWDVATGRRLHELPTGTGNVLGIAVSPRGRLVATASSDGYGRIWRVDTGELVATLVGHVNHVTGVAFRPDGNLVVTSSSDKTARVWRVDTGDAIAVLAGHDDSVGEASFSPDGKAVLTASADGTARLWDPEAQPRLTVFVREPNGVAGAAYVGDGLVVIAGQNGARLARAPGGTTVRRLVSAPVSAVAVSGDGALALASGRRVTVYDAKDRTVAATLRQPSAVTTVAFSPDGNRLAVGGVDGVGRVWTLDGKLQVELHGHGAALTDVTFSPDGEHVATSSRDRTARVWNARTGTSEHILEGHRSDVTSVAFSPDGRLVLTAGRDGDARLWNSETGARRLPMRWHFGAVSDASFSPDGKWIVTAGPATAQIWRTGSQTPLLRFGLGGHTRPLTSAVFDPTSRVVLTAGLDGTVRTYRCRVCGGIDELVPIAQALLAQTASSH